jgi:hypothetical protein
LSRLADLAEKGNGEAPEYRDEASPLLSPRLASAVPFLFLSLFPFLLSRSGRRLSLAFQRAIGW